ncbi:hypothetical protein FQN57_007314 [Myotisia sp. PD_48]|nr:hypothetical protein FQN57_007314 [Myotisia sp. PD_48]
MTSLFDRVPFDIWHQVALSLDPNDYVNLSRANRRLYTLLLEEGTAKKTIKAHVAHTIEASLAARGKITYRQALERICGIREAVAMAQPYSASLLAFGEDFVFNQGILCYMHRDYLRVLDVRHAADFERVIDLRTAFDPNYPHTGLSSQSSMQYTLLNYCDGIIVYKCKVDNLGVSWLVALDVQSEISESGRRVRFARQLESTRRLFVRHNASALYYGTHSAMARHGHHEWVLEGFSFDSNHNLNERSIQLDNFVGADIGSTVCFEIKDGYFYAVSNQTSFEDEEIDWTSYYICVRFPLNNPKDIQWQRIWRRQHREGPINDAWTNLSLRIDESTRQLVIVECRREWINGGSENFRTWYRQPLDCFEPQLDELHGATSSSSRSSSISLPKCGLPKYLPVFSLPDEPLAKILDSHSKPNYEPPKKRLRRYNHSEYTDEEAQASNRRDFTLSNTKYHSYNLSASAHIDIVNDPPPNAKPFSGNTDRLRLRIGSRKRKCPIDYEGEETEPGFLYPPTDLNDEGTAVEHSDERFESRGIKFWPPNDAPAELMDLVSPTNRVSKVQGASDERFLIYSTNSPSLEGSRAIILISFDPSMRLKHMKSLNPELLLSPVSAEDASSGKVVRKRPLMVENPSTCSRSNGHLPQKSSTINRSAVPQPTWFRTEPATYLRLNKGFWLR